MIPVKKTTVCSIFFEGVEGYQNSLHSRKKLATTSTERYGANWKNKCNEAVTICCKFLFLDYLAKRRSVPEQMLSTLIFLATQALILSSIIKFCLRCIYFRDYLELRIVMYNAWRILIGKPLFTIKRFDFHHTQKEKRY